MTANRQVALDVYADREVLEPSPSRLPLGVRVTLIPLTPLSSMLVRDVFRFSISSSPMNTALVAPFCMSGHQQQRPAELRGEPG